MSLTEDERKAFEAALKDAEAKGNERIALGVWRVGPRDRRGPQEEA